MIKLKPCPFCGKEVKIKVTHDDHYVIECDNCNSATSFPYLHSRDDIINAWNTRPNPWHTGTPKEEGDYLVAFRMSDNSVEYGWCNWNNGAWDILCDYDPDTYTIVAWMPIPPYEEKENGGLE